MKHTGEGGAHRYERYERAMSRNESRDFGRKVISAALKQQGNDLKMEEFSDVYSPKEIASDERYVTKVEASVSTKEKDNLAPAQIFEQMFTNGVMLGNWLGNLESKDNRAVEKFQVEAHGSVAYDDIRNKIDTFTTLTFTEPIEDEEYDISTDKVAMGFDVTTNNSTKALVDKITRSYNGNEELPFGFSQLKYYSDDGKHGSLPMLPRYTIGLSASDVNAITETARVREKDGTVDFGLFSGQNLINRFKVLSEIRAQNELYQAMLPDDMELPMVQQANVQLYAVDQCLHDALAICTQELVQRKCLPAEVIAEVETARKDGRGIKARSIVQNYLMSKSHDVFVAEAEERAAWNRKALGDDDTFVQIINICNELKDAAYAGDLDAHRAVMAHNQSIDLPEATEEVA